MGRVPRRAAALAVTLLVAAAPSIRAQSGAPRPLSASHLAVRQGDGWRTWWTSAAAPSVWHAPDLTVQRAVHWQPGAAGMDYAVLDLAGTAEAWRTRVVVVRVDPSLVRFHLDTGFRTPMRADWSLDRVPPTAVLAFNTGQFVDAMPWGWVVLDGRQFLPRGLGPLAVAVVGDSSGNIRWIPADSINAHPPPHAAWAFESYPELLHAGTVPFALQSQGRGVDLEHRDARLALGRLRDGRLLVALTRFDALGPMLGMIPFGLTIPEMAAVMGALGCRDAVLLDGGISAQLMVRDSAGAVHAWHALRRVPLAMVGVPR